MKGPELLGREIKCFNCGKPFISHEEWAYKKCFNHIDRKFCSWRCLREAEKKHGTRKEQKDRIIKAIMDGLTNTEIVRLLEVDNSRVVYWRKQIMQEEGEHGPVSDVGNSEETAGAD